MGRRNPQRSRRVTAKVTGSDQASLISMFNVAAFTASRNVTAATKAASFRCWIDPTHLLDQGTDANRVLLPSADASMRGQLTCAFNLTNVYASSKAATFWTGRHDGVAWTEFAVFLPTQGGTGNLLNTLHDTTDGVSGRSGSFLSYQGPSANVAWVSIERAAATVGRLSTGAVTQNSPTVIGYVANAGAVTRYVKSSAAAVSITPPFLATAPANTLRLGLRHSNTQGLVGNWWGSFFASYAFSAAQLAQFFALIRRLTSIA